jgi:LemA protein
MTWLIVLAILIPLAFIVILVIAGVGIYNRLVTQKHRYQNAYAQIDVQLKRRYDLIPNLVETAKGYMKHEQATLEAVIQARNAASSANARAAHNPGDPAAMQGLMGAEAALTGSLGKLFALSEAYPDLKANQNMMKLQEELTSTENRIAYARQAFNDSVTTYNVTREQFPNSLIAGPLDFQKAQLLEATQAPEERQPVRVAF